MNQSRFAVLLWVGTVLVSGPLFDSGRTWAAIQGDPAKTSIQERLNRVSADLFARAERVDEDIRELKEVLTLDPKSAEAHLLLGIAYRSKGSEELIGEAVAELRQALEFNPGFVPARFYLAHIYLDLGRPGRAREELEAALVQAPANPQFLALLGEAERQLKNPTRTVEVTRQALRADKSFAQARYYLGLALFDLGQRDEAIKELEAVVASSPNVADASLSLGTAYLEVGRVDDAVRILNQATAIDPARPDIRIQLARAYRTKGLLIKADEQLKLATPRPNTTLASSYYKHQQVELDLTLEQGVVKLQRRQLAAALEAFRKVLGMDPNHGPANRYMAEAYLLQGLFARASEYAARAETLGSPLPESQRKLLQDGLRKRKAGGSE